MAVMCRLNPVLAFGNAEPEFSKKNFGDDFYWGCACVQ